MPSASWTAALLVCAVLITAVTPARGESPSDRSIAFNQAMLRRKPLDARAAYRLGDAYVQKARETGDVAYFDLAEKSLRRALEVAPNYADAARHLGYVLYMRHDFAGAVRETSHALALDDKDGHAFGVLGDALLETGQYAQATHAYDRMMSLNTDLYSLGRRAGLKSVRGDVKGAIEDLQRAIAEGRAHRRPAEAVAWAQWQLGNEHFAVGNMKASEAQYQASLRTYPNYARSTAGLAQVRAAQKRYDDAIALYQKTLARIPQPDYAAALGDVFTVLGRAGDAKKQYDLVEYVGRLNRVNQVLYNRELAYFYADHDVNLPLALELARKELEVRQDVYAHDLLAWALLKNGRPSEALEPMRAALAVGTRDPKLHFHAGMIHLALGDTTLARDHLRRALALNPRFTVLQAPAAERVLQSLAKSRG